MRRRTLVRASSKLRALTPMVFGLEARELLSTVPASAGRVFAPMFEATSYTATTPPSSAYTPSQIAQAYGFTNVTFNGAKGDGTGTTIAIVDAYDDPTAQADLNTFDTQFSLPATTLVRVNQTGGTSYPSSDSTGGWEEEESLDIQWAHAVAPGATIMLVEAKSPNDSDLLAAVDYGAAHANVVSMSWGGGEFSGETSYDTHFNHAGTAFVASSGDNGAPISWPAASADVLAVGGTALTLSGSTYASESGWSGSGGGPSAYVGQPSYQSGIVTQETTNRANPDVSYDASPNTGFAVYDGFGSNSLGWFQVGGTSAGAPQWAALLAIADQGRAASGLPSLDSTSPTEVMSTLYKNASSGLFHDVTTGSSSGSPAYSAGVGYDYVTGLGSPKADLVVPALVGVPAKPVDTLSVAAPTSTTAGTSFTLTVTAKTPGGATDPAYLGTVHFTSTDAQAGLPANYTFTAADNGVHTFTIALKTAAAQSVTAADTATSATKGTASGIAVSPAAASQFVLSGLSANSTVGASQSFTITAKDAYGNVATGYTGTVHLTSSDTAAGLPANYTFAAADMGIHAFSVTFNAAGSQTVTVADTVTAALTITSSTVTVAPAAPISLSAVAASTSGINLSWSAAAGATGYSVERSANGSTGWAQVGTTTGATTYADSGLAAGTTYYYRVRATGGGAASAYSNIASVATTGSTSNATATTLWSNTYTPSIDYYAGGNYEVGLKIKADVAGSVTGVRFFKQTWMAGYTHVGHVWSSGGALLGSVTFTNETGYGWEQANFTTPISVAANTVYVVSFSTGGGYFGISSTYFNGQGVDSGPLHGLANGVSGGDGVYGTGGRFPGTSGNGMNFWADLAFTPTSTGHVMHAASATPSATSVTPSAVVATGSASQVAAPASAPAAKASTVSVATTSRVLPRQDTPVSWVYRSAVPQGALTARSQGFYA